jgi:hypothetical protein
MVDQNSLFLMTKMAAGGGYGAPWYAMLFDAEGGSICNVLLPGEGKSRRSQVAEDYILRENINCVQFHHICM